MRELRFLGLSPDGSALLTDTAGERYHLPLDHAVRTLLGAGRPPGPAPAAPTPNSPPSAGVTPREVQRRVRHGESPDEIAEAAGVPVERVARFAGPVLAERAHQVERARRGRVDGRALGELVDEHLSGAGLSPQTADWDAWRVDEDGWRVRLAWDDGPSQRTATWSWQPATGRLRPLDPVARVIVAAPADDDELTAVLRPIGTLREAPSPPVQPPASGRPGRPADGSARRPRRASVPSWEQIAGRAAPPEVPGVTDGGPA